MCKINFGENDLARREKKHNYTNDKAQTKQNKK